MNLQSFSYSAAASILSHPTWDLLLLFTLIAVGFFYGIWAGRRKVFSTLVYTYVALALMPALPLASIKKFTSIKDDYVLKSAAFGILFILLFFLLARGRGRMTGFPSGRSWWHTFVLGFVEAGFLAHIFLSFLPPAKIKNLSPVIKTIFASPGYHVWWMLIPIVLLILVRRMDVRDEW